MGILLGTVNLQAQAPLEIQGTAPDLYVMHTVTKGETFYSLSRSYSVPPKEIAAANNLAFDGGLQLGQTVKIPLTKSNFMQGGNAGGQPVYHKVAEKETLYRISVNYNKVPLDNIRHWNNFTGDGVQKDSYLIVGYLKGSGNGAAVAAHTPAAVPASTPVSSPAPAPVSPAAAPPVTATSSTNTAAGKETASSSVLTPAPPVTTNANAGSDNRDMTPTSTHTAAAPAPAPAAATPPPPPAGASFEQLYEQQTAGKKVATEKGPGAWFKSNAGPGKYYALHNTAPRGTIIKVTNPLNGKSIYAKVLEAIPQMKQNAGLIIKLSDSALEALGTNEAKFYCELSYEN
ncbi:MAG TPA: LysM peptidoglycan-binding domain-containing protein [Chitinophaga sp.]|uniref:LysM peptidoglycan-binding domain-containing protein n=1 Tax=Chitinophaga sp. TaxID=1869181 RepID=UPI002DBB6048|nr:LysM peptidoglycan-binding domain-containing protein [Chitinophaga sp.]HEU4552541.1 LysM peptidoglycan-binding domain-containing protein [Chitinophaga sp.]